ncbi:hypothetical protein B0I72DRAFT_138218 [Yarrowia lipolytica]|nr:hypothetical protein YALI1_D02831g [Yarrowia lipolytica]KAB8279815.1 hypothetical protein BKA91DRAFT_142963 [Yarrowia lipolytica]KAE8169032.1 hypothetical protein BKA90DRAFT_143269 [Yarrowia lipolytica]QNP98641.1 DNA replication complex GINS protein PSF3 [Yarrowia lipolytica]RDW24809.1 hypothetical protein B0I71DRAFT_133660 [Yarrowia lipolytica]
MGGYYDLDEILMEGQKIPCRFEVGVPNLGFLEGRGRKDMNEGTIIDLPIWIADVLSQSEYDPYSGNQECFVTVKIPHALKPSVLNALKTDAPGVDLRYQSPLFFALAIYYLELFEDEELETIIATAMAERISDIYDNVGRRGEFVHKYDEFEKMLYKKGCASRRAYKEYMATIKY